jgi:hypothetical protein
LSPPPRVALRRIASDRGVDAVEAVHKHLLPLLLGVQGGKILNVAVSQVVLSGVQVLCEHGMEPVPSVISDLGAAVAVVDGGEVHGEAEGCAVEAVSRRGVGG